MGLSHSMFSVKFSLKEIEGDDKRFNWKVESLKMLKERERYQCLKF